MPQTQHSRLRLLAKAKEMPTRAGCYEDNCLSDRNVEHVLFRTEKTNGYKCRERDPARFKVLHEASNLGAFDLFAVQFGCSYRVLLSAPTPPTVCVLVRSEYGVFTSVKCCQLARTFDSLTLLFERAYKYDMYMNLRLRD